MKVTLNQLKKLLFSYRLKAKHAQPTENGFVVQTNYGKKLISIWDDASLLRWSNSWREELYRQGLQQTQQFLPNQNKKKYIHYGGNYFALSIYPEGRGIRVDQEDECRLTGELFAQFHIAVDHIDCSNTLTNQSKDVKDSLIEGDQIIKEVLKTIEQKKVPTLTEELIYANIPLVDQRFKRAAQLWEEIKERSVQFPLSLRRFHLDQLMKGKRGWLIHGGINCPLATRHQDTAHLISEIYEKSNWSLASVSSFLDGYQQERRLTEDEMIYILVRLVIPFDLCRHLEDYILFGSPLDDKMERMVDDFQKQNYLDELTLFIGRYMDKCISESA